jgi:CubicO group peptidase (beta-lactamase class C family)
MIRAALIVPLLFAPLSFGATPPQFADPGRRAKLEAALPEIQKVFEQYRIERRIPGLVYGVVIDGEPVVIKGLGVRDRASNDPVTPDTVFRIASMTKSFTALAILRLRDEGELSLEDPVSKWIPEFARIGYPTTDTVPIRIRQLLSHSAGFPEDNPWGDRKLAVSDETLRQWLEKGIPFSTPPGTRYEYSNYGFALLGRIVSKASGMPYREYLESRILVPLGMRSTTLDAAAVPPAVRAEGYRLTHDGYAEEPSLADGAFGAMGGLLTNARDLARYVAYHLSAYPPRDSDDTGPVRRSSLREMQSLQREGLLLVDASTPGQPPSVTAGGYGFGLRITRDCRFDHVVGHGGGLPGFGSYMQWLPDYGVGMFAMANLTYAGPARPIDQAWDILRASGALQPRQWPASPALIAARDTFMKLWDHWTDETAREFAADNLFLDRSAEDRRQEIERLKQELGKCQPAAGIQAENWLRGAFRLSCERGGVDVAVTLAPTVPPRTQYLSLTPVRRLDQTMRKAAESAAAALSGRRTALRLPEDFIRRAGFLRPRVGACRVGETLRGDGRSDARLRLDCERGPLNLTLRLDKGAVTSAEVSRPDSACPGY